ncbi:helix-turn-helix transcriptional regulator [Nakamurella sp. GG22]
MDVLVGSQELTRLLGVKRARVYQLSNAPDFPRPVAVLAMGSIWRLADIAAWADHRGRTLDLGALDTAPESDNG